MPVQTIKTAANNNPIAWTAITLLSSAVRAGIVALAGVLGADAAKSGFTSDTTIETTVSVILVLGSLVWSLLRSKNLVQSSPPEWMAPGDSASTPPPDPGSSGQ